MLTFVANDERGLPQKRKHTPRACERCRKRKKRCGHLNGAQAAQSTHFDTDLVRSGPISANVAQVAGNGMQSAITASYSPQSAFNTRSLLSEAVRESASNTSAASAASIAHREYTAPARMSERTSEEAPLVVQGRVLEHAQSVEGNDSVHVGDLNPEGIFLAATSPQLTASGDDDGVGVWSTRNAVNGIRASLPRPARQLSTSSIFGTDPVITKLLLPYLQEQCLRLLPNQSDYKTLETIFVEEVQPLLPVLQMTTFRSLPEQSASRVLLKQTICLAASTNTRAKPHLSLDLASTIAPKDFAERLSRAVRTSLDLGLVRDKLILIQVLAILSLFTQLSDDKHLSAELNARAVVFVQTLGLHLRTQEGRTDHAYVTRLFLCVWTVDRLNAAFHGRPVIMHERDFGHNMKLCIGKQEPAFQLMLRIVDLLDKVISLYRPTNDIAGDLQDAAFPSFEQLLDESGAHLVKSHLIATIETFYHAVAMLSCRAHPSQGGPQEVKTSSAAYVRQGLSSSQVTSTVSEEFHGQLSLLPFVPYSLSLALRVSYRELRTSKTPIFRARARKQMLEQCRLLRELGEVFWSAVIMVELAEQTIKEMDKVTFNVIEHQQQQQQEKCPQRQTYFSAHTPPLANGNTQQEVTAASLWHLPHNEMAPLPSTYDPNEFDLSMPDEMAGFDVFQYFDPSIDLNNIDATLGDFSHPYEFMGFPG